FGILLRLPAVGTPALLDDRLGLAGRAHGKQSLAAIGVKAGPFVLYIPGDDEQDRNRENRIEHAAHGRIRSLPSAADLGKYTLRTTLSFTVGDREFPPVFLTFLVNLSKVK